MKRVALLVCVFVFISLQMQAMALFEEQLAEDYAYFDGLRTYAYGEPFPALPLLEGEEVRI